MIGCNFCYLIESHFFALASVSQPSEKPNPGGGGQHEQGALLDLIGQSLYRAATQSHRFVGNRLACIGGAFPYVMRSSASLTKSLTSPDAPNASRRALSDRWRSRFSRSFIKSSMAAISSAVADLAARGEPAR
jgi:hypothetical protein